MSGETPDQSLQTVDTVPDFRMLAVSQLHPDETQPRTEMESESTSSEFRTLEGLAQSIRERGVLQPLRVQTRPDGSYLIRSGHRRYAAARLAGIQSVPCIVVDDDGDSVGKLIEQITENTQRKAMTANEMSLAVKELLNTGLTQAEVARKLGIQESKVTMLVRLLALPAKIRKAFDAGVIESPRAAYDLERMPPALQDYILSQTHNKPLTQNAVRELKMAWELDGQGNLHPFQMPPLAPHLFAALKKSIQDDREDQYDAIAVDRDRDDFFGKGWRNCAPASAHHQRQTTVKEPTSASPQTVHLASLTIPEAFRLIKGVLLVQDGIPLPSELREEANPTAQMLSDWINAEIKLHVRPPKEDEPPSH